jgi:hypothetical protein
MRELSIRSLWLRPATQPPIRRAGSELNQPVARRCRLLEPIQSTSRVYSNPLVRILSGLSKRATLCQWLGERQMGIYPLYLRHLAAVR